MNEIKKFVKCIHANGTLKNYVKVGQIYEVDRIEKDRLYLKKFPGQSITRGIYHEILEKYIPFYTFFEYVNLGWQW